MLSEHGVASSQHAMIDDFHRGNIDKLLENIHLTLGRLPQEIRNPQDEEQRRQHTMARSLRRLREHASEPREEEIQRLVVATQHAKTEEVRQRFGYLGDIRES